MVLEVQITAQGFSLDDKLQEYVSKKTVKLDRYLNGIQEAHVDLKYAESIRDANDRFSAQITVHGKGYSLRTEERTADVRSAFDSALDKMQRRISNYKGKRFSVKGDGASLSDMAQEVEAQQTEESIETEPTIERRKKLALYPMDEEEAIEQMRLLDHEDFFLFYNMDTSAVNLLYRRRDGSYGLIETELA